QSCSLCPNSGGAFKQTAQGEWIHLLCAIWVPETFVSNDVFMEPVIGIEDISKQRWKFVRLQFLLSNAEIFDMHQAFHVTCARKSKLLFPMRSTQGSELRALA
ncbi:peregrin-like protein, partial [Mycena olivaceomarginata]